MTFVKITNNSKEINAFCSNSNDTLGGRRIDLIEEKSNEKGFDDNFSNFDGMCSSKHCGQQIFC